MSPYEVTGTPTPSATPPPTNTLRPTRTPAPLATVTSSVSGILTEIAPFHTPTQEFNDNVLPVSSPVAITCELRIARNVRKRAGPGIEHAYLDTLKMGRVELFMIE